jgi:hypothetical protein
MKIKKPISSVNAFVIPIEIEKPITETRKSESDGENRKKEIFIMP